MNLRPIILLQALLCAPLFLGAQEERFASGAQQMRYLSPYRNFATAPLSNPAANFYRYDFAVSEVGLSGEWYAEKVVSQYEKGDGFRDLAFDATSFLPVNEKLVVWGDARYHNGQRYQVLYNETSDYDLLYPYVVADMHGGDLKSESYSFSGGLSYMLGKWHIGGGLGYSAGLEYRTRDPRPDNRLSGIDLSLGATRRLGGDYHVGVGGRFRNYRQSNKISFEGIQKDQFFQMLGMGVYHYGLSGANGDLKSFTYNLLEYGGSLSLLRSDREGWSAHVDFNHLTFDRIATESNVTGLNPIQTLDENSVGGTATYKRSTGIHRLGIALSGLYKKRTGHENEYTEPPETLLLNSLAAYVDDRISIGGDLIWAMERPLAWNFYVAAGAYYHSRETNYINVEMTEGGLPHYMTNHSVTTLGTVTAIKNAKRSIWVITARGSFDTNLSHSLTGMEIEPIPDPENDDIYGTLRAYATFNNAYIYEIDRLGCNTLDLSLSLKWNYRVGRSSYLFVQGGYRQIYVAGSSNASGISVRTGFCF